MNSHYRLLSYQQRSSHEMSQVKSGFTHGALLAVVLWAMLASLVLLVLR